MESTRSHRRWLVVLLAAPLLLPLWLLLSLWVAAGLVNSVGHTLVARLLGMRTTLSLGSVGQLWQSTDQRWQLAALPGTHASTELDDAPLSHALAVLAAGPLANLVVAVVLPLGLLTTLAWWGWPDRAAVVGHVEPAAEAMGWRPGDRVLAVGDQAVSTWSEVHAALETTPTDTTVEVERDGQRLTLPPIAPTLARPGCVSPLVAVADPTSPLARAGLRNGERIHEVDDQPIRCWYQLDAALNTAATELRLRTEEGAVTVRRAPDEDWGAASAELVVGDLLHDTPAEQAGLRVGDRILSVDGTPIRTWNELGAAVNGTTEPVVVEVERTEGIRRHTVDPTTRDGRRLLGIRQLDQVVTEGEPVDRQRSLLSSMQFAADFTWRASERTAVALGDLLVGRLRLQGSEERGVLTGPVEVLRSSSGPSIAAATFGISWATYNLLFFVYNLLPLPFADGTRALDQFTHRAMGIRLPLRAYGLAGIAGAVALWMLIVVMDILRFLASG